MNQIRTPKPITFLLIFCMLFSSVSFSSNTKAAKVPKINIGKNLGITVGSSKKLSIKKNGVKKLTKVTWKSSKKSVASLNKTTGSSVTLKALKKGKAKITATVRYKISSSSSVKLKKLTCNITVTNASITTESPAVSSTTPTPVPSTTVSPNPSITSTPIPTMTPGPTNLLSALGRFVENVGSCISYNSWGNNGQVADTATTAFIKENYNSLTAENQMKPSYILGNSANKIRLREAKDQGYYIPTNYTETYVPVLDYSNIDTLMKYASENGLRIRYHGLLWHEQTSNWFFRTNYDSNGSYVTPEIMDARLEYYIKNIMEHVYTSEYGDVMYCWDVVNEYFHMTECIGRIGKDKGEDVKCFYEVYGEDIFVDPSDPANSPVKFDPPYVKKAFKWAYEVLEKYNLTDSVELVYNDYDTNLDDVRESVIAVTTYINTQDELNPNGDKLVSTVGMQGHDKLGTHTVEGHRLTFEAIKATGLNMQITEMDLALNEHSAEEQLQYWSDMITLVINQSKSGAKFTGFTWWGMTDSASWLGSSQSPLLCGSSVSDKKPAYYKVISTAYANY